MVEIKIPFNEWSKERLESGDKIATTRNKRYGEIGDTFEVELTAINQEYELLAVFPMMLSHVSIFLYHIEGAESPGEFHDVWCDIHKRAGKKCWIPNKIVYVHLFHEI